MSKSTPSTGQKRKAANDGRGAASAQKRSKLNMARNIPVQTGDAALSTSGELNIASFIKAREFEINTLDKSMRKARAGLNSRAFQQVPRHLRRRTASHNVKKVPRRLRRRAEREMKEDNTPTVTARRRTPSSKLRLRVETTKRLQALNQNSKNVRQRKKETKLKGKGEDPQERIEIVRVPRIKKNILAKPPKATLKFQRRQVHKTWLPTHLWHAKRAHMPKVHEPLWRMAIPLSPTEKSYRPSHRAVGGRGCIAWDTSYMSTICCRGTDHALENMLNMLKFPGESWSGTKYRRWKAGTRFANGWTFSRDDPTQPISPVQVIWCPTVVDDVAGHVSTRLALDADTEMPDHTAASSRARTRLSQRLMIRSHPSAFLQLWNAFLKLAKMQKPQVLLEDLRFELGSIEIVGPGSTEALIGVLKSSEAVLSLGTHSQTWTALAGLNNPASLPQNAALSLDVSDPRLRHPPKQVKIAQDDATISELSQLIVSWPPDQSPHASGLFNQKVRWSAGCLPSPKAINRRRALAPPGVAPSVTEKDPAIPVMLLASRPRIGSGNLQGKWTVLLPWKCVDPVWRSLMYYPLSSGSTPRFGGLEQQRQIAFEQMTPWFPGDTPGTEAGKAWERYENEERFDAWIRKPPSRRLAYDTIDLGLGRKGEIARGWACDWEYLFSQKTEEQNAEAQVTTTSATAQPTEDSSTSSANATERPPLTQRQRKAAEAQANAAAEAESRRRNTSSPESDAGQDLKSSPAPSALYTHLPPPLALPMLKTWKITTLPDTPSLITVRITLLGRGTPNPTARIYRLPSSSPPIIPLPTSEQANPGLPAVLSSAPTSTTTNSSSSVPQPSVPPPLSTSVSLPQSQIPSSLRAQWLALDPSSSTTQPFHHHSKASSLPKPLKKQLYNHHSRPPHQTHLPLDSLKQINYMPPGATAEVIEEYGPKASPPPPSPTASEAAEAEKARLMRELFVPGIGKEEEGIKWPPCPGSEDLVGFVTSGGFNLAEGRGTAVAGLWVQRLVEGWRTEVQGVGVGDGEKVDKKSKLVEEKQRERERHLCIVRNSGESVGRLGIWELCE